VRLDTFAWSADPEGSTSRRASSAHTYRLLIFKDRLRIHYRTGTARRQPHNYPAPLRSASLHQQQRNGIMESERQVVNPLRSIFFRKLRDTETDRHHNAVKLVSHPI
jgi:hypothetical protein